MIYLFVFSWPHQQKLTCVAEQLHCTLYIITQRTVKTLEAESLFLWGFVLALVRRMTAETFEFLIVVLFLCTIDFYSDNFES